MPPVDAPLVAGRESRIVVVLSWGCCGVVVVGMEASSYIVSGGIVELWDESCCGGVELDCEKLDCCPKF